MARDKPRTRVGFASGAEPPSRVTFDRRSVIYSRHADRTRWMESELARSAMPVVVARHVGQLVAMLETLPRPEILVIDVDGMTEGELGQLRRLRVTGWSGVLVLLGSVAPALRALLGIDRALAPPYVDNMLCDEIARHVQSSTASTLPIPIC